MQINLHATAARRRRRRGAYRATYLCEDWPPFPAFFSKYIYIYIPIPRDVQATLAFNLTYALFCSIQRLEGEGRAVMIELEKIHLGGGHIRPNGRRERESEMPNFVAGSELKFHFNFQIRGYNIPPGPRSGRKSFLLFPPPPFFFSREVRFKSGLGVCVYRFRFVWM